MARAMSLSYSLVLVEIVGKLTLLISTTTADIFNACRESNHDGQEGGWWCPVPAPAVGEEHDHRVNCNHGVFARVLNVRNHFYEQHFDFGVWEGVTNIRRSLRTIGLLSLKCQTFCGKEYLTLEEVDDHSGATGHTQYNLHRFQPIKV